MAQQMHQKMQLQHLGGGGTGGRSMHHHGHQNNHHLHNNHRGLHHPAFGSQRNSSLGILTSVSNKTSAASGSSARSSLHRFSVDALAGTGSHHNSDTTSSKDDDDDDIPLNVTSDDEMSLASWDEDIGIDDDDDVDDVVGGDADDDNPDEEIDVGPLSPTAVSTTSESSRGGINVDAKLAATNAIKRLKR